MNSSRKALAGAAAAIGMVTLSSTFAADTIDPALRCRLGAYALSDGRSLAVAGLDGTPHDLRYVLSSGEFGKLAWVSGNDYVLGGAPVYGTADFSDCATGAVTFHEADHTALTGKRVPLPDTNAFFDSDGTRLHGKLVLPTSGKPRAIMVWIQGSDDDPETDDDFWQYTLPLRGIGVFVYDKRGSGGSAGELSADFYVRADDTAAAVAEARRLAPGVARVGVFGGSQGGWVAPLTATKTQLDFVIVGYGLAEGVTAQDRDEVEEQVRAGGYGDDAVAKARQLTDATTRIVKSGWKDGWAEFDALKTKFAGEPWLAAVSTENGFTGAMLRAPSDQIRLMGPKLDKHVSFNYDPVPVIASIAPRQLWVLGGSDHTAPNTRTVEILRDIQTRKANLDLAIFRDADHDIAEAFETGAAKRHRHSAGYFDLVTNWILDDTLPASMDAVRVWR